MGNFTQLKMKYLKKLMKPYKLLILFLFTGCATISTMDNTAYVQCTSMKIEVIGIMDKATERWKYYATDIEAMNKHLAKTIEYEKHRPLNDITISMWKILWKMLNDSTTVSTYKYGLFPGWQKTTQDGFFAKWQKDDTLHRAFINEAELQIGEAFDLISELESKKIREDDKRIEGFIINGNTN